MPKILINEKDKTSPGSPDSYANFSVLIAGLARTAPTDEELKRGITADDLENARKEVRDSNGVYEFNSAEAFKEIIGLVAPEVEVDYNRSKTKFFHYGNQMAYELLNMGYTVLYKVVDKTNIASLAEESFWEDFKDKSSYDFRFVTHGLLESSVMNQADKSVYDSAVNRLTLVEAAIAELEKIAADHPFVEGGTGANSDAEVTRAREDAYKLIYGDFLGFVKPGSGEVTTHYETFVEAYEGLVGTEAANYADGERATLNATIKDKTAGGVTTALINAANGAIANLAKYTAAGSGKDTYNDMNLRQMPGRGDCVALIEADENRYLGLDSKPEIQIIDAVNEMTHINADNGKFCALTVPSVYYKMAIDKDKPNEFNNNVKFPGAFHYLACFINSLKLGFAEWYAAAGYTRGVASYMIDHTSVKLGEIAINALEPRNYDDPQEDYPKFACNVIANFRGSYYLWGNRTAHPLGKRGSLDTGDLVASSFLNIRQLCSTIKKQLYVACRSFTFDPNSDTLWVNFVNAIRPTLELMKADQGIRDYKVLKVYTDKKATLKAKIRIIPIEAVEDFDLEVSLEDSFGETAAVVTE